jgi:SAM-dependent methyltransferase
MTRPRIDRPSRVEIARLVAEDLGLPQAVTDEMAIPTHTHSNPLIRWLFWRRYVEIAELAAFGADMTVLEFGCGIGVFLPTLCLNSGRVLALDLFPQYAMRLARNRNLDVHFPENLDAIEDNSLDRVVAADVLEHIDDLGVVLSGFRAKLKPGGRLLMSGPTESVIYRLGRVIAGFGDKGHYHVTNVEHLRSDISSRGFELLRTRNLPFPIPPHLFRVHEFGLSG